MIADLDLVEQEGRLGAGVAAFVALLVLSVALFAAGWWMGSSRATAAAAKEEQARTFAAVARQVELDNATLAKEHALRVADRRDYDQYRKEHDDAQAHDQRLIADLRRDVKRLRVPIRAADPATPDAGRPAAGGSGQDRYAELSPDAGAFLVGLLERGDEGIRKHAAVVKLYNRLAEACSQPPIHTTKEEP